MTSSGNGLVKKMFVNPYLVGGYFTAGRLRRQGTVAGTVGQIPYAYGWNLVPEGAGGKRCCPVCHDSPYGIWSTSVHPRIANPVFGMW